MLDLSSGFHRFEARDEEVPKITFRNCLMHPEFIVVPLVLLMPLWFGGSYEWCLLFDV